jgi:hypothetical protein
MRGRLMVIGLLACSGQAMSQTVVRGSSAEPRPILVPKVISDPATADRIADTLQSLSAALLDLKVGTLQAAVEGRKTRPEDRDVTVRDLIRRSDPDIDRDLEQKIAQARPKVEQGLRAMNEALPQVTSDLKKAQKSIERAIANMPDPDYPRR